MAGFIVIEPGMDHAMLKRTLEGLPGVGNVHIISGVSEDGREGQGKYDRIWITVDLGFAAFAMRQQGYATVVKVLDPSLRPVKELEI